MWLCHRDHHRPQALVHRLLHIAAVLLPGKVVQPGGHILIQPVEAPLVHLIGFLVHSTQSRSPLYAEQMNRLWEHWMPWKHTGLHAVISWCSLIIVAGTLLSFLNGWFWVPVLPAIAVGSICMIIEQRQMIKEMKQLRRHAKDNLLADQVIKGEIALEDLPPEQQEDVRVALTRFYYWREERS